MQLSVDYSEELYLGDFNDPLMLDLGTTFSGQYQRGSLIDGFYTDGNPYMVGTIH
jgi:hypothetical protein